MATPVRLWPAALVLIGLTLSAWAVARAARPAVTASTDASVDATSPDPVHHDPSLEEPPSPTEADDMRSVAEDESA